MSAATARPRCPACNVTSARSSFCRWRPASTTHAPRERHACATPRPIPEPPPMMRTERCAICITTVYDRLEIGTIMSFGIHHPDFGTIDLTDVQLFVAVAEAASFVGASRKTRVPTSTVSRAVARLEESLGRQLLHRTSRRVSVTQEGAWLLERTGSLLEELRGALSDLRARETEPSGTLRVTAPVLTGAEH